MKPDLKKPLSLALFIAALGLAACLLQTSLFIELDNPVADEIEYLSYAKTLADKGSLASTHAGPKFDTGPGREPLYPAVLSLLIRLDPLLHGNLERCLGTSEASCVPIYRSIRAANAVFFALAAFCACLIPLTLGFGLRSGLFAGLYIACNLQAMRDARYVISDPLALCLSAALGLALASAAVRPTSSLRWIAVAIALGLLTLLKAIYLYFAAVLLCVLALIALARKSRTALMAFALTALIAGVPVGSWMERNRELFGQFEITRARDGIALSTREVFDTMTAEEYSASFVYWMRGPGSALAKRFFPEPAWHRFELEAKDGFFNQGQYVRYEARIKNLMEERHIDRSEAEIEVRPVIISEILSRFWAYLATMLPLGYRGIWCDEFIVFGLPALAWLLLRCRHEGGWRTLAALAPGLFNLAAYPAVSLNMPRYQLPALACFAVAAGIAAAEIAKARQKSSSGLEEAPGKGETDCRATTDRSGLAFEREKGQQEKA